MLMLSPLKSKKYRVVFPNESHVDFGASGYKDFILSGGDEDKKKAYLARHEPREDWRRTGIDTAGFWARWILWNKPTLKSSIADVNKRFNFDVKLT